GTDLFRWLRERYQLLPQGIDLRLYPSSQPVNLAALVHRNEQLWARTTLPDIHSIRTDQEIKPEYVSHQYAAMLTRFGLLYQQAGDLERAEAIYRRAADLAPNYQPATRLAFACYRTRSVRPIREKTLP